MTTSPPPEAHDEPPVGAETDDENPGFVVDVDDEEISPPHPLLQRSPFAHPEWAVGMVLVMGAVFLLIGLLGHPIWLLLGSPFILTLAVWIVVRVLLRRRPTAAIPGEGGPDE